MATLKTFEETRLKQVYHALTCDVWYNDLFEKLKTKYKTTISVKTIFFLNIILVMEFRLLNTKCRQPLVHLSVTQENDWYGVAANE
jgi:hypothetical protein